MDDAVTRHLRLADGRVLSYSDTGTGQNGTWVHCHGIPGSRFELSHLGEDLVAAGLRVIVADRPGYGGSTPCPGYDFAQHTEDVRHLADNLGLERFAMSGFSGGGVFALALAHELKGRVERVAIAGTPAVPLMENPFEHASELTANAWKAALENVDKLADELQSITVSADVLAEALMTAAGPNERRYLLSEPVRPGFYLSIQTALQQGSAESAKALARDTLLMVAKWPFLEEELNLPLRIIHGQQDKLVHRQHQRALMAHLPCARNFKAEDKEHFSVVGFIFDL